MSIVSITLLIAIEFCKVGGGSFDIIMAEIHVWNKIISSCKALAWTLWPIIILEGIKKQKKQKNVNDEQKIYTRYEILSHFNSTFCTCSISIILIEQKFEQRDEQNKVM